MTHTCQICNETFSKGVLLSNHIRWKHKPKTDTSLFQPKCSCVICKKEIIIQGLSQHFNKHFKKPKICPECNSEHHKEGKFCSHSCASTYNNKNRDKSVYEKISEKNKISNKEKSSGCIPWNKGNSKERNIKGVKFPYTKLSICTVCSKYHTRSGKTCSDECYKIQLSKSVRESGYDFAKNRGRHKKSYLEESFENWLISNRYNNFITEHKFKNFHEKKVYYADFYFPDRNLIIELDGSQHKDTKIQDEYRDNYISTQYGIDVIRITHKEYRLKSRIEEIKELLEIN